MMIFNSFTVACNDYNFGASDRMATVVTFSLFIYYLFILFATLITKNIGKEEEEKKRSGEET